MLSVSKSSGRTGFRFGIKKGMSKRSGIGYIRTGLGIVPPDSARLRCMDSWPRDHFGGLVSGSVASSAPSLRAGKAYKTSSVGRRASI